MPQRIKAIQAKLQSAQTDAERIDLLNELAWRMRLSAPAQGLDNALEALRLSEAAGYAKGQAESLKNAAVSNWYLSNYDIAAAQAFEALNRFLNLKDKQGEAAALNWIGNVTFRLGDIKSALNYHLESLRLKKQIGDKHGEAYSLSNIAHIYRDLKDFNQALTFSMSGLNLRRELNDGEGIAMSLHDVASVYGDSGDEENALRYFDDCLAIAEKASEPYIVAVTLHRVGALHAKARRFSIAEANLLRALQVAENLSTKDWIYKTHAALSELYEQLGDLSKALRHFKKFREVERDVFSQNADQRIKSLSMQFEMLRAKQESEIYRLKTVELAEANQFKTDLLAIAAHDLKNPLQSIMGFATLARECIDNPSLVIQHLDAVERASNRMLKLILDLLDAAVIDSGKLVLQKTPVNLSKLFQNVIEHNLAHAEKKGQRINTRFSTNCVVEADEKWTYEVLDNLLSNAIKYSPKESTIVCGVFHFSRNGDSELKNWIQSTSELTPNFALAIVKDEGQGLTDADKEKLFGKFQRLSARPTDNEISTGLGLSIVKQIVELHGGRVWAESAGKGKGATFFVELPIQPNGD
jgi:signal transduction histidine kinase